MLKAFSIISIQKHNNELVQIARVNKKMTNKIKAN